MGGINCDSSNGRSLAAASLQKYPERERRDSTAYNLAIVQFCKSLCCAHRHFLDFNECVEDLVITERTESANLLTVISQLNASLVSYREQLRVAIEAHRILHESAQNNFADPLIASEAREGYGALSKSDQIAQAETHGLLPSSSALTEQNSRALAEGGDQALVSLHGHDLSTLLKLCACLNNGEIQTSDLSKYTANSIRDVDHPLVPFCLRSMTLWVCIWTRQIQWAHHNTVAFRSVTGMEVTTDHLIKSIQVD